MKRIISVLLVAVCIGMAMPAQAQLQWGIKGGANLSSASLKNTKLLKGDSYTGFFVGPMLEFTVPVMGLGVDAAVVYSQTGINMTVNGTGESESVKQHGIEIPVNLKYTIGLGKMAGVFVAAGPQFGFGLKSDDMGDFWSGVSDNEELADLKEDGANFFNKSNFSINVGVGVKLLGHLQVGVNYNIPMGKTAEYDGLINTAIGAFSAKTKTWQISAAYLF